MAGFDWCETICLGATNNFSKRKKPIQDSHTYMYIGNIAYTCVKDRGFGGAEVGLERAG